MLLLKSVKRALIVLCGAGLVSGTLLGSLAQAGTTVSGSSNAPFIPLNEKQSGAPLRILKNHVRVTVQSSGLFTERDHQVLELLNPALETMINPYQIQYSADMAKLRVLRAWVSTPSGQKYVVPARAIFVRPEPMAAGAPMYSHAKVLSIVLPKLGKEDQLHIITEKTQTTPYFAGQFSQLWEMPVSQSARNFRIDITAPRSMHLRAAKTGNWIVSQHSQGKLIHISARMAVHHARYPGPSTVDESQFSPLFEVSTFPSWAAVGKAYWSRAADKAAVTPIVQKTADTASHALQGWDAEKALYTWDSHHIRYVGLELGVGGYVPISASKTLETRYGDCKAHATLLQALFNAKGFKLYPTLINWNNVFTLPPLPTPFWFNHAIDYAPERHLFLDSTGTYETPGQLAIGERDKPSIVTGPHPRVVTTPGAEPDANQLDYAADLTLHQNGDLSGVAKMQTKGWWAWMYRQTFASIPPSAYHRVMNTLLLPDGGGSGTFVPGNPDILDQPFAVTAHWHTVAYTHVGDHISFPIPSGPYLTPGLSATARPMEALTRVIGPLQRQHPVTTYLGGIHWTTTIHLPEGYQVQYLPPAQQLHNQAGSFTYALTQQEHSVTVHYTLQLQRVVYNPQQYPALRKLLKLDYAAQQSPIILVRQ
jgi:Transglutaminase-like superfamily.